MINSNGGLIVCKNLKSISPPSFEFQERIKRVLNEGRSVHQGRKSWKIRHDMPAIIPEQFRNSYK